MRKTCCRTKISERVLYAEMDISPVILIYVFRFLDLSDLARAAGTCFVWWNVIKRYRLMENNWEELDLSGTGKLYCCIPRRAFRSLRYLSLASTQLSSRHLQQMMMTATYLQRLDISNCPKLDQIAIFKAKEHTQELLHIDISSNRQFTILVIACLCSCPELVTIEAHGLEFSAEELLFLSKTFESARSGSLQIETDEGYDTLCITNIFERELFE